MKRKVSRPLEFKNLGLSSLPLAAGAAGSRCLVFSSFSLIRLAFLPNPTGQVCRAYLRQVHAPLQRFTTVAVVRSLYQRAERAAHAVRGTDMHPVQRLHLQVR